MEALSYRETHPQNAWVFVDGKNMCDLRHLDDTRELIDTFKPDVVIHLASRVGGLFDNLANNATFLNDNISIDMNVLSSCHRSKSVKKVVSCLSTCVFPAYAPLPLTADAVHSGLPHHSNLGYSYAKRLIDVQNRMYGSDHRPFVGVIPCNLFGPYDNFSLTRGHVIPALIHRCYLAKTSGTDFVVRGSGLVLRQFMYSIDAARLLLRVLELDNPPRLTILAPPEEHSVKDVALSIASIMGFEGRVEFTTLPEEGQFRKTANPEQIRTLFPDFTFTPFEVALRQTIDWFVKTYPNVRRD